MASSIDFWRLHDEGVDLEFETLKRVYPPRFKMVVSGKNATESTIAQVSFSGSLEDLDTDIILEPDIGMLGLKIEVSYLHGKWASL